MTREEDKQAEVLQNDMTVLVLRSTIVLKNDTTVLVPKAVIAEVLVQVLHAAHLHARDTTAKVQREVKSEDTTVQAQVRKE
jgi:hypothetical protein